MSAEKGFVMLPSYYEAISPLEDGDRLALYDAILGYVFADQEPVELHGVLKSLFTLLRPNIDNSIRQYRASVENGKRGGRPRKRDPRGTYPEKPSHNPTGTQLKPNQNPEKTQLKPRGNPTGTQTEPSEKLDKEKDKEKDKDKDNKVFCTEPQSDSVLPVLTFPLNDGSQYGVTEEQVKEWKSLYPAVDVSQALRNMRGWLLSNPQRRKTRKGIARFITGWLSKEQDRGGMKHEPLSSSGRYPEEDDPWGITGTQL